MIEFLLRDSKAGLNIPKAFAIGKLGEGHAQELVPTCKGFDLVISLVPLDAMPEFVSRQEVHELSENGFSSIHEPFPSSELSSRKYGILGILNSNRLCPFSSIMFKIA